MFNGLCKVADHFNSWDSIVIGGQENSTFREIGKVEIKQIFDRTLKFDTRIWRAPNKLLHQFGSWWPLQFQLLYQQTLRLHLHQLAEWVEYCQVEELKHQHLRQAMGHRAKCCQQLQDRYVTEPNRQNIERGSFFYFDFFWIFTTHKVRLASVFL